MVIERNMDGTVNVYMEGVFVDVVVVDRGNDDIVDYVHIADVYPLTALDQEELNYYQERADE